ncbi:hypothetical protein T03_17141 [Trichinella britovi]|uniref:Uncharacterized protein n=1 Tax=Trichinella britovi TaxID=45882 RepID=A0A0V1AZZ0_TRIBR|nr:hypothetical protein T03_18165 [Trichinella britovi]KRY30282.1 hypothetical protein T03_17141 [Trichinella britovi]
MKENRVAQNNEILNKSAQKAIYSTRTHLFAVERSKTY